MKTSFLKWGIAVFALLTFAFVGKLQAHTRVNISVFYSSLAPYGEWIDYRDYGLCWRPTVVEVGWRPYTHGHWVWTDYGWTWVSDFDWGWGPFHYGRWTYDDFYGWIWVPDDVWGPGWVDWRYSDAYVGWAPLPPGASFQVGVGISFGGYSIPHFAWSFTYCSGFLGPRLVILPYRQNVVLIRGTRRLYGIRYRESRIFNVGPRVDFVERATGTRVRRAVLVDGRDFGERRRSTLEGDRLYLHRPDFGRPREQGSTMNRERENKRTLDNRERGRQESQGVSPQRERRPRERVAPQRERRTVPESRGRREGGNDFKAPEKSSRDRQERRERPHRER